MVDEAQKQKQKPKKNIRGGGKDLKTLNELKNSSSKKMLEKILEEEKDKEIKKEIKRDPRQEPFIPRDYLNNPPTREEIEKYFAKNSSAKGGMVKGYRKGGSVKNKKAGRLAKRGYGICKK